MPERNISVDAELRDAAEQMKGDVLRHIIPVFVGEEIELISLGLGTFFDRVGYTTKSQKAMEEALGRCIPSLIETLNRGISCDCRHFGHYEQALRKLRGTQEARIYGVDQDLNWERWKVAPKVIADSYFVTIRRA